MDAQTIAALVIAGIPLEAALEHTVMPKLNSTALKTALPALAGIAVCWATNAAQGQEWKAALFAAVGQGLTVGAGAMAVHGTPVGTIPGGS